MRRANSTYATGFAKSNMEPTQNFWQKNMKWIIIVGVIMLLVLWVMGKYNFFVSQEENITNQWAQVENQYQRRFDLIPNVINVTKGAAQQEQDIFLKLAEARSKYAGATTIDEKAKAAGQVESAFGRLLAIVENYPQLQSIQVFRDLKVELEGTENRLSVERMKYNELVRVYNTSVKVFPSSVLAKMFGKSEHAYFEVPEENQVNPKVEF